MSNVLAKTTITMLSALTYRVDAKRQVCLLPLAGIYWDDELPDLRELFKISEDDREQIFRLLGLRYQIWKGEVLTDEERQFWQNMQSLIPTWAFFERQEVTPEDLQAQDDASRSTTEVLQAWFADADEVSVTEKMGVQRFSLKFDLTKGDGPVSKRRSWWGRVFRRRQGGTK
jgi:hypothetical protein